MQFSGFNRDGPFGRHVMYFRLGGRAVSAALNPNVKRSGISEKLVCEVGFPTAPTKAHIAFRSGVRLFHENTGPRAN